MDVGLAGPAVGEVTDHGADDGESPRFPPTTLLLSPLIGITNLMLLLLALNPLNSSPRSAPGNRWDSGPSPFSEGPRAGALKDTDLPCWGTVEGLSHVSPGRMPFPVLPFSVPTFQVPATLHTHLLQAAQVKQASW